MTGPSDEQLVTLPQRLMALAMTAGERPAFHVLAGDEHVVLTWEALWRQAAAYARLFAANGVRRGEVVLLCLRHGPSLYPAFLGAMIAETIPAFVAFPTPRQDPELYWRAHQRLFARLQSPAVLTYRANAEEMAAALPPATALLVDEPLAPAAGSLAELAARQPAPDVDAIALLQHSSGTTGDKKGVALTYRQVALQAMRYAKVLGLSAESRIASWLPLYHDMGLVSALVMPLYHGATVVSLDAFEWVLRPHLLLEVMDRHACDFTWLPNFALNHLVRTRTGRERYALGHVRAFVMSSEPCRADSFDRFVTTFSDHGVRPEQLQASYAMAETVLAVTQTAVGAPVRRRWVDAGALAAGRVVPHEPGPSAVPLLSNGPPLAGMSVRVAERGAPSSPPDLTVGELEVRGDFLFAGYFADVAARDAPFVDGWYRTRDLGFMLDGEVYVLGRADDVIVQHGVNYFAHDLEEVASTVPGVVPGRSLAFGVDDPEVGSNRIELAVERPPLAAADDDALRVALKRAIASRFDLTIARVHLIDPGGLVKTTSGKLSRKDSVAKLTRALSPSTDRRQDIEQRVVGTIASTFAVDPAQITATTRAGDVDGWDSLAHTVLMIRLGNALGTEVPERIAARAHTVGDLVDLLAEHLEVAR